MAQLGIDRLFPENIQDEFRVQVNLGGKIGWAEQVDRGVLLSIDQLKVVNSSGDLNKYEVYRMEDGRYLVNMRR